MKILLPIIVLSLRALFCFGEEMQCVGPWVYDSGDDVGRLVTGASLVVVGTPISADYGCRSQRTAFADVRVEVREVWAGDCSGEISIRVNRVFSQGLECAQRYSRCLPRDFLDGSSYLFLLHGKWDRDLQQYVEGYVLPMCGMLQYDGAADEVKFLGSDYIMDVQKSGEVIREQIGLVSPPTLYEEADLVVVVENLRDADTQEELIYSLAQGLISGEVSRVLKGDWDSQTVLFDPREGRPISPLIDTAERVLLFLRESAGGYGLVSGPRGFNVLKSGEILDNSRKPTGWNLNDHGIERKWLLR